MVRVCRLVSGWLTVSLSEDKQGSERVFKEHQLDEEAEILNGQKLVLIA